MKGTYYMSEDDNIYDVLKAFAVSYNRTLSHLLNAIISAYKGNDWYLREYGIRIDYEKKRLNYRGNDHIYREGMCLKHLISKLTYAGK